MRAQETSGAPLDRDVWRRSQEMGITPDEASYLLDLAAFADNRLDDDETARIGALIEHDTDATEDIAAARMLAGATTLAADVAIVARAEALIGEEQPEATLIAFPARMPVVRPWYSAATWSGLAAAIVLAGWLGFDLGSGISTSPVFSRPADDTAAAELLDPSPMLRDFTENSQI